MSAAVANVEESPPGSHADLEEQSGSADDIGDQLARPSCGRAAYPACPERGTVTTADAGCPCGCMTRPSRADDPGCIRYWPVPTARAWTAYDVRVLGLEPHDRTLCRFCQAAEPQRAA